MQKTIYLRYLGVNHKAMDALRLMEAYELDYIRVPNGEECKSLMIIARVNVMAGIMSIKRLC